MVRNRWAMRTFAWLAVTVGISACGDSLVGGDGTGEASTTHTATSAAATTGAVPTTGAASSTESPPPGGSIGDGSSSEGSTVVGPTTGPPLDCDSVEACAAGVTECRIAIACDRGECVYEAVPAGKPVAEQTVGDCTVMQCDGAGGIEAVADTNDVEDDGILCTLDACDGTTPTHTPGMTGCYSGPDGSAGVGVCATGMQMCDARGVPVGPCVGEVVPQTEDCDAGLLDEDCDGDVNEAGAACVCEPGSVSPCYGGPPATQGVGACGDGTHTCEPDGLGFSACADEVLPGVEDCDALDVDEDCDGEVDESGRSCVCGDGDLSAGEVCDDGNNVDGDGCSADCQDVVKVVQITTGASFSCALFNTGEVKCWGYNGVGRLGLGDNKARGDEPGEMGAALPFVDLGGDAVEISSGFAHTCARMVGGQVKCWGYNFDGQLGLGDTEHRGDEPGEMGNALPFTQLGGSAVQISCGNLISCARLASGAVKCWGVGGALGLGDKNSRGDNPGEMGNALPSVPISSASGLDAGQQTTCARLVAGGQIKCWGSNLSGQLGIGTTEAMGNDPGEMAVLPIVDLAPNQPLVAVTNADLSCAHMDNMTVRCWGSGSSLGYGDKENRGDEPGEMGVNLPAVDVGGPVEAVFDINAGGCVRLVGGVTKCWGLNSHGRLGVGDTILRGDEPGEMGGALPALETGGDPVIDIDGQSSHMCALFASGAVRCWGSNGSGQLGQGDTEARGDEPDEKGVAVPAIDLL